MPRWDEVGAVAGCSLCWDGICAGIEWGSCQDGMGFVPWWDGVHAVGCAVLYLRLRHMEICMSHHVLCRAQRAATLLAAIAGTWGLFPRGCKVLLYPCLHISGYLRTWGAESSRFDDSRDVCGKAVVQTVGN